MAESGGDISIDPEVLSGFLEESLESLSGLDPLFLQLEQSPDDISPVHKIFRAVHSLKGNAPFFGFLRLKALAHDVESLLGKLRDGSIKATAPLVSHLLSCLDEFKASLNRLQRGGPEIEDAAHYSSLIERTRQLASSTEQPALVANNSRPVDSQVEPKPLAAESFTPGGVLESVTKTIRVPEGRIDTFLAYVGELIVVGETLRHFSERLQSLNTDRECLKDLSSINEIFSRLSTGLEKAIMSIRRVPVRPLLQKVPRLVRDIAQSKGKQISVQLIGDDLEIDKSLVELLDAPLTHMVRNAADHGIEQPDSRLKQGKPSLGEIRVTCREDEKYIVLQVCDDGAGLNYEGLQRKAQALGMISGDRSLSDTEVVDLLFMAGVSTASEVSDISGRGVGMDVVKRSIEAAGGVIEVLSKPGQGCTFTIRLPKSVTTQIMHGFVVEVSDGCFVLPLERVVESWRLDNAEICQMLDRLPCVQRHDHTLKLVELAEVLGVPHGSRPKKDKLGVTLSLQQHDIAIVVDGVIGTRQLVMKDIEGLEVEEQLFLGGALLGDGRVALVLDVDHLEP